MLRIALRHSVVVAEALERNIVDDHSHLHAVADTSSEGGTLDFWFATSRTKKWKNEKPENKHEKEKKKTKKNEKKKLMKK